MVIYYLCGVKFVEIHNTPSINMLFERRKYLDLLIEGKGNGLVKIITGIRRCGKSFLLFELFRKYLLDMGVQESHIIALALDDWDNRRYQDPDELLKYIKGCMVSCDSPSDVGTEKYYILLDEVQLLDHFVEVLLSLMHNPVCDVYVTGSNSKFLSSDVVTEFRGRGDEIRVWPLSFAEYYNALGGDRTAAWKEYYTYGGLPQTALMGSEQKRIEYLRNLYESTYLRDVKERNGLRNVNGLQELVKVLSSGIGSMVSVRKIANTFKSVDGVEMKEDTIRLYMGYLQDAFLIEESVRYDVKGRKYIGADSKWYFTDMGLRAAVLGFRQQEETHIMENVIYNELRMRGCRVDVGVLDTYGRTEEGKTCRQRLEVDFVVNKGIERIYIQSVYRMPTEEKVEQELRSLKQIGDSFRKLVIVGDDIHRKVDENGIITISLLDFLLDKDVVSG